MGKLAFVGDVHMRFDKFLLIVGENVKQGYTTIQVGDMGVFCEKEFTFLKDNLDFRFIRGNHDNPQLCNAMPNYLGDFGYNKELNIFFVGGGYSIDYKKRIEGRDWWRDEELKYSTFNYEVLPLYNETKPDVVVTHECPTECFPYLSSHHSGLDGSTTARALNEMLSVHAPKLWIFGHHHMFKEFKIRDTEFVCLDMLRKEPTTELKNKNTYILER